MYYPRMKSEDFMTNLTVVSLYFPVLLITLAICCIAAIRDRRNPVVKPFVVLCLSTLGWQVSIIAFYLTDDASLARWLFDVKLVFVAFTPVALFNFVLRFYSSRFIVRQKLLFSLLCIVPLITSCLALTSPLHALIRAEFGFGTFAPFREIINVRGWWFWVHTAHCYVLMMVSGIIIVRRHIGVHTSASKRLPSLLVLIGTAISFLGNVLVVFDFLIDSIDITLLGLSISNIFVYAAIATSGQASLLAAARDEIFNYMDDYVLILDEEDHVVDYNPSAGAWLHAMKVPTAQLTFSNVMAHLDAYDDGRARDTDDPLDVYVSVGEPKFIFSLRRRPILNGVGLQVGMFVTFYNITRFQTLIENLEETAGIDALTRLGNRTSYEDAKNRLRTEENLPMGIILGDVNGLKQVNDTLGHRAGDALLCEVAKVLEQHAQPGGYAFRIGGDEFLLLLPGMPEKVMRDAIGSIRAELSSILDLPFRPSIALGGMVMRRVDENIDDLVALADKNMYTDKANDRRHNR